MHDHNDILKICTQSFIAYYLLDAKITTNDEFIINYKLIISLS